MIVLQEIEVSCRVCVCVCARVCVCVCVVCVCGVVHVCVCGVVRVCVCVVLCVCGVVRVWCCASVCVRMCVHDMPMYGSNHVMHTKTQCSSTGHKSVMLVTPCGRKRGFQQNG